MTMPEQTFLPTWLLRRDQNFGPTFDCALNSHVNGRVTTPRSNHAMMGFRANNKLLVPSALKLPAADDR